MNIFVLHSDPNICAKYHCDKHVVKMILESAQMICTTHHLHPNTLFSYTIPYRPTHINHPCNRWLRDSLANYNWLFRLTNSLNLEYKHRYGKSDHKSWLAIRDLPVPDLPNIPMTRWARAMPIECKIGQDVIKSYRNYYQTNKQHILHFTRRNRPRFLS